MNVDYVHNSLPNPCFLELDLGKIVSLSIFISTRFTNHHPKLVIPVIARREYETLRRSFNRMNPFPRQPCVNLPVADPQGAHLSQE